MHRNLKAVEEKEPNRLKVELYRLQYEEKKIVEAKERLKQQEKDIIRCQDTKESLKNEIERYQVNEEYKRGSMNERIEEQRVIIARKMEILEEKNDELNKVWLNLNKYYRSIMAIDD